MAVIHGFVERRQEQLTESNEDLVAKIVKDLQLPAVSEQEAERRAVESLQELQRQVAENQS